MRVEVPVPELLHLAACFSPMVVGAENVPQQFGIEFFQTGIERARSLLGEAGILSEDLQRGVQRVLVDVCLLCGERESLVSIGAEADCPRVRCNLVKLGNRFLRAVENACQAGKWGRRDKSAPTRSTPLCTAVPGSMTPTVKGAGSGSLRVGSCPEIAGRFPSAKPLPLLRKQFGPRSIGVSSGKCRH